jgi:predicted porin
LVAAAGLLLGAAITPAKAADLGGGCCADLEERVAELEATTARKGNRVVSLQIYGQVNKALMLWDDGVDSDAYIVDNEMSSSRIGLKGKARINSGLTAGYHIEFELKDASTQSVYNFHPDFGTKNGDDGTADGLSLRQNYWYLKSDTLGRIAVGHQSTAADGAHEIVLSNSIRQSNILVGNSFRVRYSNGDYGSTLGEWASNLDAGRNDVVRYDTPTIYGFILSTSWGDNDYGDVALRFKKDFGAVRLAAAISYQWDDQDAVQTATFETLGGSISAMHVPTGLYASFQAANREYDSPTDWNEEKSFWYVQAGIERKLLSCGATTIYGEYGLYTNEYSANDETEATRWGIGLNQRIDAAAMDIYANATFWSFDDSATTVDPEDLTTVLIGSRIKF